MNQERLTPTLASLLSATDSPFIHRDLSWLQFNERVLSEARDETNPLLERAKFLSISSSNMDEFFMIRFSSINRSITAHVRAHEHAEAKALSQIRDVILREVLAIKQRQIKVMQALAEALLPEGIEVVLNASLSSENRDASRSIFQEQIAPVLPPPEVFRNSAVTQLGNLQMAALAGSDLWIPVPRTLPGAFCVSTGDRLQVFFLHDVLIAHLKEVLRLNAPTLGIIRLSRDGDFTVDLDQEDSESIPDVVRNGIGHRDRGRAVRIQTAGQFAPGIVDRAAFALRLDSDQCLPSPAEMCLYGLWSVINRFPERFPERFAERLVQNPRLYYKPMKPLMPPQFVSQQELFSHLKSRDILLHHPYDSFDAFVQWIKMACKDPAVEMIELTVYRTDALSPVIDQLKSAGKSKNIRVVIELRARFDELNNLRLADELRAAGVHVAFGFGKLKMHAKIALVTRVEDGQKKYYTHVSTGNYNAVTARQYTDLAILTGRQEIGQDARHFFDSVWESKVPTAFKTMLSAPSKLHRRILAHIEGETKAAMDGKPARIIAKVNALVDETVIQSLYRASCAGVKVDLIVRGACSLIPGVSGLSENIRVISVIDRFLEHSRIYFFESSATIYLSSADWMPRNFFSRLEIAYPVLDPHIYRYLRDTVLPTYLADNVKARELTAKGTWKRVTGGQAEAVRSQYRFYEIAQKAYRGTALE